MANSLAIGRLPHEGPIMLILTRRPGEEIFIGDDITVVVLGVKGRQVRVGVNAPKEVAVHREEIYDRIRCGKQLVPEGVPDKQGQDRGQRTR